MRSALDAPILDGLPILGNSLQFAKSPARSMVNGYRKFGPVFRIQLPGHWNRIVLAGPSINQLMARDMAKDKEGEGLFSSREFWKAFIDENGADDSILASDGNKHRAMQSVMREGYHSSALHARLDRTVPIGKEYLENEWKAGTNVVVLNSLQRQVTEELGEILAAYSLKGYVDDIRIAITYMLNALVVKQSPRWILLSPRYQQAKRRIQELSRNLIELYKPQLDTGESLLVKDIIRANRDTPDIIPDADLTIALYGPFFAGIDTEANALGTLLYELAAHQDMQDKAAEEAQMIMAAEDKPEAFKSATYLKNCIYESMRLWPITPMLLRTSTREFEFEGFTIPAGETMFIGVAVAHFLEDIFPNPLTFNPMRQKNLQYFAGFGFGTHMCLGRTLAIDHMIWTLARILSKRRLSLVHPDYKFKLKSTPTPGPTYDFKLKCENR